MQRSISVTKSVFLLFFLSVLTALPLVNAASDGFQYVSVNGNDSNDGLSWSTAKLTIGAANSALPSGGDIWGR